MLLFTEFMGLQALISSLLSVGGSVCPSAVLAFLDRDCRVTFKIPGPLQTRLCGDTILRMRYSLKFATILADLGQMAYLINLDIRQGHFLICLEDRDQ